MQQAGNVGWAHLLTQRRRMLDKYDEAAALTRGKPVAVYKGIVAEDAFREWLGSFLPSRFGVTSGYIVPPIPEDLFPITHFDVIVYDRLNAPVLWSETGSVRAIPVEHVRSVIEIKSRLTRTSFTEALKKLYELAPLLDGIDAVNERYKTLSSAKF